MDKRKRALAALLALTMLLLLGCGAKDAPAEEEAKSEAAFRVRLSHTVSLDPARANGAEEESVVLALYEGLMRVRSDENGQATVVPGIAKEYQVMENFDGTVTYVFTLRSTARWSDGKRIKASDFVYAWKRLADPALDAPQRELLHAVEGFDEVTETGDSSFLRVEAKGTDTFLVTLDEPCAGFIVDVCAAAATVPLRRDIVEGSFAAGRHLVVNGEFCAEGRLEDGSLRLVKNGDYYENRLVEIDKLEFLVIEDEQTAYERYQKGEIDYLPSLSKQQMQQAQSTGNPPAAQTVAGVGCVLYNHLTDAFSDLRIRTAFDHTIDRSVFANGADIATSPAMGFVPHGISNDLETEDDFRTVGGDLCHALAEGYAERCEEARRLLTQSGHYNGAGLDGLECIYAVNDENAAAAYALKSMWIKELGVTVEFIGLPQEEYEARLAARDFDMALAEIHSDRNDAMFFLSLWHSESPKNILGYVNTAYDLLLGVGENESDLVARTAFLHDAELILLDDHALSPLYFASEPYLISENWQGLVRDAFGRSYYADIAPAQSSAAQ